MGFGRNLPVKLVGWNLGDTVGVLDIDGSASEGDRIIVQEERAIRW